jgi:hypothetical protein
MIHKWYIPKLQLVLQFNDETKEFCLVDKWVKARDLAKDYPQSWRLWMCNYTTPNRVFVLRCNESDTACFDAYVQEQINYWP